MRKRPYGSFHEDRTCEILRIFDLEVGIQIAPQDLYGRPCPLAHRITHSPVSRFWKEQPRRLAKSRSDIKPLGPGEKSGNRPHLRRIVSAIRTATTNPDASVKAATTSTAGCIPHKSAMTPASSAPTA